MAANIESMFYFGETPWHNLGTEVDHALNSKEALQAAGLDWKVVQTPIMTNTNIPVPGYVANVRKTDNRILGIVSQKYKVVQNDEAFQFVDLLLDEGAKFETAGSLSNGKQMWMITSLDKTKILGDEVIPYLVFTNSFDGSGAVKCAITPIRVVCQNTLTLALSKAERIWSVRHTQAINTKLEDARNTLFNTSKYIEYLGESADRLSQIKMSTDDIKSFLEYAFPLNAYVEKSKKKKTKTNKQLADDEISNMLTARQIQTVQNRRNAFMQIYQTKDDIKKFRNTAYGLVQAAADFEAHELPHRNTTTAKENRFMNIVNGGKWSLMGNISNYPVFANAI